MLFLCAILATLSLLFLVLSFRGSWPAVRATSVRVVTTEDRNQCVKISKWEAFKTVVSMLLNPSMPNYEFYHNKLRQLSSPVAIFDLKLIKEAVIMVTDLGAAKRIMSSNAWAGKFRDNYYLFKCTFGKPYGMVFGRGENWKEARALSLRLLHQCNFYNQENMTKCIKGELDDALNSIDAKILEGGEKATFSPHHIFQVHAVNLLSQVCWSQRHTRGDRFMTEVMGTQNRMNRSFNAGFGILEMFPSLARVPGLTFYGDFSRATAAAMNFFKNVLTQRRKKILKSGPKDFTDYFLLEIDKGDKPNIINDQAYCVIMRDLTWASADTTTAVLEYSLLEMALRPELQNRVQNEIDLVLGFHRVPTFADRASMPLTQAVLLEILRYSCPVPLSVRCPAADTKLGDHLVPKGSLCGINIYSIHRSEDTWGDPLEFRPDRFLSPEGKIVNADKIIPFGYGKHFCIGESVAKTFMFIGFVRLMQRYTVRLSNNHPPPTFKNVPGLVRFPDPYFLTFTLRKDIGREVPVGL